MIFQLYQNSKLIKNTKVSYEIAQHLHDISKVHVICIKHLDIWYYTVNMYDNVANIIDVMYFSNNISDNIHNDKYIIKMINSHVIPY